MMNRYRKPPELAEISAVLRRAFPLPKMPPLILTADMIIHDEEGP